MPAFEYPNHRGICEMRPLRVCDYLSDPCMRVIPTPKAVRCLMRNSAVCSEMLLHSTDMQRLRRGYCLEEYSMIPSHEMTKFKIPQSIQVLNSTVAYSVDHP